MPDLHNAKEHFQSFLRKKNKKSVKQSEIITNQPNTFENRSTINKKSVITKHSETSHRLSKTLGKGKKEGFNNSLYSDTKNNWKFFEQKKYENNKSSTCF